MSVTSTQLILETVVQGTEKAVQQVRSINTTLTNVSNSMVSFGKNATLFLTAPIVAAGSHMVKAASDAAETQNKFESVFGALSKEAGSFAESLGSAVNRNLTDIKDGLSSFQAFSIGMGYTGQEALKVSEKLQALSLDFASFYNLSDDEALQRFISAMSGSSEVLDRFGVNIKQSALDMELQSLGLAKSTAKATELEKAQARLSIITKTLTKQGVVGDAIKTSESYANQLKGLQADVKTVSETLGNLLIPKARELIGVVRSLAERFMSLPTGVQEVILSVAAAAAALGPLSIGLGSVLKLVILLVSPLGLFAAALLGIGSALVYVYQESEVFRQIVDTAFTTVRDLIGNSLNVIRDGLYEWSGIVVAIFRNIAAKVAPVMEYLTNFIKSVWTELKGVLAAIFQVIFAPLEAALTAVSGVVKTVLQILAGDFDGAFQTMSQTGKGVMNSLLNFFSGIWELIKNVFKIAITYVVTLFGGMWSSMAESVSSLGATVLAAVSSIWQQITDGFNDLVDQAFQWGVNLVTGFVDGIMSIPGKVAEAASSVASTVKSYLGFSSPTEKGPGSNSDEWAPNFVAMFADGLKAGAGELANALSPMAGMIQGATTGSTMSLGLARAGPIESTGLSSRPTRTVNVVVHVDTFVGKEAFSRELLDTFAKDIKKTLAF